MNIVDAIHHARDEARRRFVDVVLDNRDMHGRGPMSCFVICQTPRRAGSHVHSVTLRVTETWAASPSFREDVALQLGGASTDPDLGPSTETLDRVRALVCDALVARGYTIGPSDADEVIAARNLITFRVMLDFVVGRYGTDAESVERMLREVLG
jgi:hypothetical protein